MAQLVDVSDFQGTIDFAALKGHVDGIVCKATDGLTFTADTFRRNRSVCFQRKIAWGPYHFFRMGEDGAAQAQHFLSVAQPFGAILPMVDIEEISFDGVSLPLDQKITRLSHFIQAVEAVTKKRILIYTNWNTWTNQMGDTDSFAGHPLWLAQTEDPNKSGLFGGWKSWAIWQDATTTVPGINGAVDYDIVNGEISSIFL